MRPETTRRRAFGPGSSSRPGAPPPLAMEADRVWKAPAAAQPPRTFPHPLEIPLRPSTRDSHSSHSHDDEEEKRARSTEKNP
jgi:hypothetical protein